MVEFSQVFYTISVYNFISHIFNSSSHFPQTQAKNMNEQKIENLEKKYYDICITDFEKYEWVTQRASLIYYDICI